MTRKEVKERDELIVDFIKESGTEGVPPAYFRELFDLSCDSLSKILKRLCENHKQIVAVGSTNKRRYIWREEPIKIEIPKEIHSAFLKNRYENTNKNNEGYTDMTATKAIKNVEPEKKEKKSSSQNLICPEPGEVWLTKESNGDIGFVYILSYDTSNERAQTIRLYDIKSVLCPVNALHDVRVKLGVDTLVGDLTEFSNKRRKYLTKRVGVRLDEQLMKVRKELASILGIKPIWNEKPVESATIIHHTPPVEEKVAPAIPDGYISKDKATLDSIAAQLVIWKSVAEKLLDSRN